MVSVNIPHRHDLAYVAKTNLCIQAYNSKLKNILKTLKHVSLVEMSTNRRHFTKHGFHLNNLGKEWLAKQIASQIGLIVKFTSKANSAILLKWKEEATNLNTEINMMSTETDTVESLIPTSHSK
jgi:hypothetical protein